MGGTYRKVVGGALVVLVWGMYVVRVVTGVGCMHDEKGNQAPAAHYLAGALIVTAMVGTWIVVLGRARRGR